MIQYAGIDLMTEAIKDPSLIITIHYLKVNILISGWMAGRQTSEVNHAHVTILYNNYISPNMECVV